MFSILYDEYKKHKTLVRAYLALCIILAFTVGAYSPNITASSAQELSGLETISQLNQVMFGKAFKQLAGDYSEIVTISAEPFTALLFIGIAQDINMLLDNPVNLPSTNLGQPAILVVIALCLIASKLMKANSGTRVVGMITWGNLETFLGTACVLGIALVSVVGLASGSATSVVSAAGLDENLSSGATSVVTGVVASIFSAFMGFFSLIVNYIVKTVISGLSVIATLFSGVPFVSFTAEMLKTGLTFFLFAINTLWPVLGYILNVLVFILCCVIFKVCYNAVRYFEEIYFVPFVKSLMNKDDAVTMIPKRVPKKVKKMLEKENITPDFVLPVFVTSKMAACPIQFRKFEKLWFVNQKGSNYIYINKHGKESDRIISLDSTEGNEMYLYRRKRYFEIFTYWNNEENKKKKYPKKAYSLVFAKTYEPMIEQLISDMGYIDLVELQATTKAEKKAAKKLKREETWADFKNAVDSLIHSNRQEAQKVEND